MDITSDSAILAYLAYGITELNVENNTAYLGETEVYLEIVEKDGKQVIAGVYYDKDYTDPLPGTNINGINSRLEGFTHDVKIKDLLGEEKIKNNTILEKLGDYTIDGVADAINDFEVAEIVNIKPDDAVMMLYLAFGVTSVSEENGVYTARKGDLTVYFKTRVDDNGETYLDSIYSDAELSVRLDGTKINNVGAQISGLTKEVKLGELIKLEGKSPIIELIKDSTLENVGNVISDLTLPDVVKIPVNNIILAYIGYGITEVDKEAKTAVHNGQKVILTVDEDGNIVGVSENGVQLKGTKIDDIDDRINYLMSDLTVGELLPELNDSNNKLVKRIAASKLNGIGEIVNNLTVVEVVDVPADNAIMAYLAYGITEVNVDENGKGTAMFGEEQVDLILTKTESEEDDKVNVTYYIVGVTRADGTELESTPINGINAKIADLTSVVKIKNIINIDENSSPVMRKLGEYTLDTVDEAISDITVADVMDVDADSAIMSYIAYGISKVDLNAGTAKLGDDSVYLDIGDGKIKGAYYDLQHDAPVPGTKINEINARITGLMNDLTIGELIKIPEGNAIMNAVKDSTINSLSDDINNLTINELYADKIYVGKDEDGNELPAVMKKVVEGNADANNNEIEFDTAYLYYKLVSGEFGESSAVYKMVGEGETKGKLDEFTDGYYTYGMPSEIWQLLLVESSGGSSNEKAYSINDLTNMMDNISDNMERFNLRTLNNAGILKFTDSESLDKLIPDLSKLPGGYKNKHANIPLGELTIPQAIEAIVDLMYYINNLPASTP